jgi:hypothetical protein
MAKMVTFLYQTKDFYGNSIGVVPIARGYRVITGVRRTAGDVLANFFQPDATCASFDEALQHITMVLREQAAFWHKEMDPIFAEVEDCRRRGVPVPWMQFELA